MKKVAFILGAGASGPFFGKGQKPLTTKVLSSAIRDDARWRAAWGEYEAHEANRTPGIQDHLDIGEAIALRNDILSPWTKHALAAAILSISYTCWTNAADTLWRMVWANSATSTVCCSESRTR
jgi:hypothetical protein